MGAEGRAFVEEWASPAAVAKQYADLFTELNESRPSHRTQNRHRRGKDHLRRALEGSLCLGLGVSPQSRLSGRPECRKTHIWPDRPDHRGNQPLGAGSALPSPWFLCLAHNPRDQLGLEASGNILLG